MLVLRGNCYEMEAPAPYTPFAEILEGVVRALDREDLRRMLGDLGGEIARVVPELRRRFPDLPPPLELPPEQERRYLFNSLREFLETLSEERSLLVLLDDLHWADEPTLLLLEHVAQRLAEIPVLVLGTHREVDPETHPLLGRRLEELHRRRLAHRVSLRPLPADAVAQMLQALSGQTPPATLASAIFEETEGNPFFVEEVFRHLAEEGKLFDEGGQFRTGLRMSELDVPDTVRLVIGRRLDRLTEQGRRTLAAAAVIGPRFTFDMLEALEEANGSLLDAVDEAEGARLIVPEPQGPEASFAFAHELIRQTLLSGLSAPRRQRLHLRIADAIEQLHAGPIDELAAEIAHHLSQAGRAADADRTARALGLAGQRALDGAAFEDALSYFQRALPLHAAEDSPERAHLLFQLGLAHRSVGQLEQGLEVWRESLDMAERLGDSELVGRLCSEIVQQLGWAARWEEAFVTAGRGLAALPEEASPHRARLLGEAGMMFGLGGYYEAADELIGQAVAIGDELGDAELITLSRLNKSILQWGYGEAASLVESATFAASRLRSSGALWDLASALLWLQFGYMFTGRWPEAEEIGKELEPLAIRLGHDGAILTTRRMRGFHFLIDADLDQMEKVAREDLEWCRATGSPWITDSYVWLGLREFWRGRWDEARGLFEEALRLEGPGIYAGTPWAFLVEHLAHLGEREQCLSLFQERKNDLPGPGQPIWMGARTMLGSAIVALATLGEKEEAARLYERLAAGLQPGMAVWAPYDGKLIQLIAAISAAAGQQWDLAEGHFRIALEQADGLPHRIQQPEVRRWYARMLIDRNASGDREKARSLLGEAIERYEQIGMPKHADLTRTLLQEAA
jgi:tetratricopeptide (TPR) repeat protein